jgi:hypothetical protein
MAWPRAFNRDTGPRKGLSMRGETIRGHARERRPGTRPRRSAGPPRETFVHASPCRKTPYARRKTRTPRPRGQGVHSLPAGAPVSRAPLQVGSAGRVSNASRDLARRRELDSPSWRVRNRVLDLSSSPASSPLRVSGVITRGSSFASVLPRPSLNPAPSPRRNPKRRSWRICSLPPPRQ